MRDDTQHRLNVTVQRSFTVYSAKEVLQCELTWSLQLRENEEDFNVEEKGSELIEQQRLQLKGGKAEKT